jgi:hypothetical protein
MTLRKGLHCVCTATLVLAIAFAAEARDIGEDSAADRAQVVEDMRCAMMVVPQDTVESAGNAVLGTIKGTWKGLRDVAEKTLSRNQTKLDADVGKKELRSNYQAALKRGNWLPMSTEVAYGQRAHDLIADSMLARDSEPGQKLYPRAEALLDEIKRGIDEPHAYDFKLFIRQESTLNAMALPGGFLYLDAGLLQDPAKHDMARFALAHEVGHVLQRHETRELQGLIVDSYKDGRDLEKAVAESRKGAEQAVALLKHVKIIKDNYIRHTMDQELQADACALRLILNVHPDGKELSASTKAFIAALPPSKPAAAQPSPDLPAVMREFVTLPVDRHPTSAERISRLHDVQGSLLAAKNKQS